MEAIIYYTKVNIVFAVLFGIYASTMRKETGFHARRALLLALPLLALTIPLLQAPALSALDMPSIELPTMTIDPSVEPDKESTLVARIILLHLVVSAFLFLALIIRIERTLRALRGGVGEAGSFFGHVHVPLGLPSTDHATILAHEHVHVREKHTFDVLLYEVLSAFCWSVPLWRIALREVRLVHELIADRRVHALHADYPGLLLAHSLRTSTATIHHTFSNSTLKTRITMLYNERSPRRTLYKLLLALPATLIAFGLVSWRMTPSSAPTSDAVVFAGADTPAEFPGGSTALMKHLAAHIRYPEKAITDGVEGTVYVSFNILASGTVSKVMLKRGVRADIDAEAIRVVSELPNWKPATSNGKAVNSEMVLPIAFALTAK
jgi:TonB family protein